MPRFVMRQVNGFEFEVQLDWAEIKMSLHEEFVESCKPVLSGAGFTRVKKHGDFYFKRDVDNIRVALQMSGKYWRGAGINYLLKKFICVSDVNKLLFPDMDQKYYQSRSTFMSTLYSLTGEYSIFIIPDPFENLDVENFSQLMNELVIPFLMTHEDFAGISETVLGNMMGYRVDDDGLPYYVYSEYGPELFIKWILLNSVVNGVIKLPANERKRISDAGSVYVHSNQFWIDGFQRNYLKLEEVARARVKEFLFLNGNLFSDIID